MTFEEEDEVGKRGSEWIWPFYGDSSGFCDFFFEGSYVALDFGKLKQLFRPLPIILLFSKFLYEAILTLL